MKLFKTPNHETIPTAFIFKDHSKVKIRIYLDGILDFQRIETIS